MTTQIKSIEQAQAIEHTALSFIRKDSPKSGTRLLVRINSKNGGYIYERTSGGLSWRHKFDGSKRSIIRITTQEEFIETIEHLATFIPITPTSESKPEPKPKPTSKPEPHPKPKQASSKPSVKFIETDKEITKLQYAIENKKNVLLKGPTGCGKSYLVEELAKSYGKKLHVINCDVELDKSELIGHHIIVDGEKGSISVWVPGIIPVAMENGDWVVFDEVNMSRAEVLSSMHQAMDYRRQITIKENKNEVVTAHEDFRLFACINPNYAGTCELNVAFRRRFNNIIDMQYLPPSREIGLIMLRTHIDKDRAQKAVSIANDTRQLVKQGKLEQSISTAHLLEFCEMLVKTSFKAVDCARVCFNLTDEFGEQEDILNIVKNYFFGE